MEAEVKKAEEETKKRKAEAAASKKSPPDASNSVETQENPSSDKTKLAAAVNIRRKSSNLRSEMDGLHISHSQNSDSKDSSKLEQDYIQMYLGELSPIQASVTIWYYRINAHLSNSCR